MGSGASTGIPDFQDFQSLQELYEMEGLKDVEPNMALQKLKSKFNEMHSNPKDQESSPKKLQKISDSSEVNSHHSEQLNAHEWGVGDVVKVKDGALLFEGVITEICKLDSHQVKVDFGDSEETVNLDQCSLVLRSIDLEVDDRVEVKPADSAIYFVGHIITKNLDGTFDVKIDSDDPDDVERHVPYDNIRKLMTSRSMASMKFHHAVNQLKAVNAFKSMGKFHAKALAKLDAIKEKKFQEGKK